MQSRIAKTIETTKQEAQYDACVKRLLSEKIILAWILKECVDEFKAFSIERIMKDCIEGEPKVGEFAVDQDELDREEELSGGRIEGLNAEDISIREGKIYYDIRFSAVVPDTKEPVQLIVNIEAQKSSKTPYPLIKRAIYYASRMISSQKNTVFAKSHYEKLRKVYSIWIQMNVDEDKADTITKYRITEENIVGTVHEEEKNYDLLTVVMLGLGKAGEGEGEEEEGAEEEGRQILRLLDILLSGEKKPEEKKELLERDFDIPMTESMTEGVNEMCNLGEGLYESAYEKGYEKATLNTKAQSIIDLMDSMDIGEEKAMRLLKIKADERDYYHGKIGELLAVK